MSVRTRERNVSHELKSRLSGRRENVARRISASLAAMHRSARAAAEELEQRRLLSVSFIDKYNTDTSANYTETMQTAPPTFVDSWKVNTTSTPTKLDYSISANNGWNSSVFLLKPSVVSAAAFTQYTVSGDIIAPMNYQPGLIVSGDPTNGGFVVAEYDNGAFNHHMVLLRETGGQLVGDEGGVGNPPVLADFGDLTAQGAGGLTDASGDTFHISVAVDRTGANPVFTVSITDTTTGQPLMDTSMTPPVPATNVVVTDAGDPANYGGTQIGWRARYQDATAVFSVTNLSLQSSQATADHAPVAPSGLTAAQGVAATVNLSWTNNEPTTQSWQIERSTDGTNFTVLATTQNTVPSGATATYTDPSAPAPKTVYYRVRAFNNFNGGALSDPSNVASVAVVVPTNGVKATYYNYGYWAGNPVDTAYWPTVDYNDPNATIAGDPGKLVTNTNGNSVIYTGKVHADTTGSYTFISNTGEDGWLYVNGILVSSDPGIHAQENATASTTGGTVTPITLTGGKDYDFVFLQTWARYYGQDGSEGAHMLWQTPGSAAPVIVPVDHLSPIGDPPAVPSSLAVSGSPTAHNVDFTFAADNTAVAFYQLQRSADGGNTWATISQIQPGSNGATGTPAALKISDAGPVPGASYQYRVVAVNYTGTSNPSNVVNATIPALPAGNTPGAEAHYFNAEYWKAGSLTNDKTIGSPDEFNAIAGPVDQAFTDATPPVSPDGTNFPDIPRIHPQSFSAVFTGKIKTDTAGLYTFVTNTDDDGWLYVNDVLVASDPNGHGPEEAPNLHPVTLLANTEYDFIFMYNQQAGGGSAQHLEWIEPGGTAPGTIIPAATATTGGIEQVSDVPHHETVDAAGNVTDVPAESAAGNLILSSAGPAGVVLNWTDQSTSELWFEVQRSTDGGTTWTTVAQAPFDSSTFTDASATNSSTNYTYRVRGVNWDGAGPFGNTVSSQKVTLPTPVLSGNACDFVTSGTMHLSFTGQSPNSSGFEIQDSTDGVTFTDVAGSPAPSTVTTFDVTGLDPTKTYEFQVRSLAGPGAGGPSPYSNVISSGPIDYSGGFTSAASLTLNGSAFVTGATATPPNALEVTQHTGNQAGSGYSNVEQNISSFDTTFKFQFNAATGDNPQADGFTFLIQDSKAGANALGGGGGGLGYTGIANSVAVKFDIWDSTPGTATNSQTGVFANGVESDDPRQGVDSTTAVPVGTAIDLTMTKAGTATGIDFHANPTDQYQVHLVYDGKILTETFTDLTKNVTVTQTYQVDIAGTIGDDCAFVGFSGGTGGAVAQQDILSWKFTSTVKPGGGPTDTITGTSGSDAITLKKDADGTDIDWTLNGGPVNKVAINDPKGLTINGNGGTDSITLDNSNGDPTPNLLVLNQTGAGSKFILIGLSQPTAGHKIDIQNSTVQINYTGSTILPAVQTALKGGQIFSSTLASNSKFAIADNDSADPLNAGQAANTILLKPAIIGNPTLSGKVGFGDFVQLARNYNKSNADWAMGDFDYDGKVDFVDLVALARNYNQSGPAATAAALTSAATAEMELPLRRPARALARRR